MALEPLYTDNHLLVIAKPAGRPVVPDDSGDWSVLDEWREWVRVRYEKPGKAFLGVVHRLDRPVSGILVFARTSKAARRLHEAFSHRQVEKIYWGVSARVPQTVGGEIEEWLLKDRSTNRVRRVAPGTPDAKRAETTWRLLARAGTGPTTRVLLELRPRTGRSHQLRLAAQGLGAPLVGDLKYGAKTPLPDKSIGLHACGLRLPHPTRGDELVFTCPPPELDVWDFPDIPLPGE